MTTQTTTATTTYTKLRDGSWGLRGAGLMTGARVTVQRRDGSTRQETVGRILWTGQGIALTTIAAGRRTHRHSADDATCPRCRMPEWDGDFCDACFYRR